MEGTGLKRGKTTILLLCVAAVAAGVYFGTGRKDSGNTLLESSGSFDLTTHTAEEVAGISWTAEGETCSFVRKDGTWETADGSAEPADQETLQAMADHLVSLKATRKIENVSSLEDYGLTEPAVTVTAEWEGGGSTAFRMGESTPFEDGYYLCLSTQERTIYTIPTPLETGPDGKQTETETRR